MQFQTLSLITFITVLLLLYWKIPHKYRWGLLLVAGYIFYACWNVYYVFILFGVTAATYLTARKMEHIYNKKILFGLFLIFEIGILVLFKYLGFFTETVEKIIQLSGGSANFPVLRLLLPVGISFYIFQTIAYVADIYHGKIAAEKHFGYFAVSVAFFPILLSGPIERIQNLLTQFKEEKKFSEKLGWMSFQRILAGGMKKIIIADSLAVYVNNVYSDLKSHAGFALLLTVVLYSIEIYCDFSGYSDIAIGTAGLFGIKLGPNFEQPYLSDSIKNFWKRWHISLTSWFRDYVYIPLGGNRVSRGRNYWNIMVTFLLSGLWHGAAWTFVLWGALHGAFQIVENILKSICSNFRLPVSIKRISTFVLISIAWVLFRAETITDAWYVLTHCFTGAGEFGSYILTGITASGMSRLQIVLLLFFIVLQILADIYIERKGRKEMQSPVIIGIAVIALFYYARYGTDVGEFIYFQF